MTDNKQSIQVTYTNQELRNLVEEYIATHEDFFTFKDVCSYILYRAMEEGKTAGNGLYESNLMGTEDCDRIRVIIEKIIREGRIFVVNGENGTMSDETKFLKLDKTYVSKIKEIMALAEKMPVPQDKLLEKTLNDYVLYKREKKQIKDDEITFDDLDDLEYFKKLVNENGLDAMEILANIIIDGTNQKEE